MQQTQELEINNNNSQVNESQLEDRQRGSSLLQEKRDDEMQNEVDHGKIEIDSSSNSEAATTVIVSNVDEAQIADDQDNVDQQTGEDVSEGIIQQRELRELETVNSLDIVAHPPYSLRTSERESDGGVPLTPIYTGREKSIITCVLCCQPAIYRGGGDSNGRWQKARER